MSKKKIGVLTSGGDCAGLNAAIRAVVFAAHERDWETIGILHSTAGLFEDPPQVRPLAPTDFDGFVMRMGGTILGTTNRGNPFAYPQADGSTKDRSEELISAMKKLGLSALIGIGGDGSFAILRRLCQQGGISFVGIPKTIDNDLGMTEASVGFDTAVAVATEALDRLQPTAASHDRVMVLEVMGRDAGHIALNAGIAGGADVILIPEIKYDINAIAKKVQEVKASGRNFGLVVVSEAVKTPSGEKFQVEYAGGEKRYGGIGQYFCSEISRATGFETRVTVLGHVQRGGSPTWNDRLLAAALGTRAVDLIAEGRYDRMVAWQNREVIDCPLEDAIKSYAEVDVKGSLVRTARALGICLGDE